MSTLSLQSRIDQLDEFVIEAVKDVCFTMLNWTVVMSIPNVVRGQAIRASSRDIKFMLKRDFAVTITGEKLQVIALGKFD